MVQYIEKPEISALFPSYLLYRYRIGKQKASISYRYRIMTKIEVNNCIVILLVKQKKPETITVSDISGSSDILSFLIYRAALPDLRKPRPSILFS